jgi:opacity protein-like surface antigen
MKKIKLLAISSAMAITSSYAAIPFNGFYLGAQAGYTQRAIKSDLDAKLTFTGGNVNGTYAHTKRSNGFLYGLMAGYGQNINGVYLGLEASLQDDTASRAHQNHSLSLTNSTTKATTQANVQTRYERSVVFGLAPRIGAVFGTTNLVYVKVGFETSRDHMTHKIEGQNGWQSKKRRKTVFVPGLGYEKAFGNVLVRAEYGYNCGANLSDTRTESIKGSTGSVVQKAKYNAHEVKLGVSYQF